MTSDSSTTPPTAGLTAGPTTGPTAGPTTVPTPGLADTLADRVAAAVTAVPAVAAMHPGRFGEVATYLPGRRVTGVQVRDDEVEVDVVVRWGVNLPATADAVRTAVARVAQRPVYVVIQDVAAPVGGTSVP